MVPRNVCAMIVLCAVPMCCVCVSVRMREGTSFAFFSELSFAFLLQNLVFFLILSLC